MPSRVPWAKHALWWSLSWYCSGVVVVVMLCSDCSCGSGIAVVRGDVLCMWCEHCRGGSYVECVRVFGRGLGRGALRCVSLLRMYCVCGIAW